MCRRSPAAAPPTDACAVDAGALSRGFRLIAAFEARCEGYGVVAACMAWNKDERDREINGVINEMRDALHTNTQLRCDFTHLQLEVDDSPSYTMGG